jgi:hypothetical protein
VALAPFNGSWAAAWRAGNGTAETIHVKTAQGAEYVLGPNVPGPSGERPALVQVGPTSLAVVFTVGGDADAAVDSTTVRGAIVDTSAAASSVTATEWSVSEPGDAGLMFAQAASAAAVAGNVLWTADWTAAQAGDANAEELWLVQRDGKGAPTVAAMPLPRVIAHRAGDQRAPALATTSLGSSAGLVAAWEDYAGHVALSEARPDIVVRVTPLPMTASEAQ